MLIDEGVDRARASAPRVRASGETVIGRPVGVLVQVSRTADLMVAGTRGHGDLRGLAVVSVAATVAAHGRCPVVIVRGYGNVRPAPGHPVVVRVDGSAASQAALRYGAGTAQDTSAPLIVVCAWNLLLQHGWLGLDSPVMIDRDDLRGSRRTAARQILDAAVEQVRTDYPDVTVTASLVEAAPAAALLDAAADAGLIVVGTRGHGAFTSLLLGSVSHVVVHASTRPVAVVRGEIAA